MEKRREEFNSHVWNHSVDPFQLQFDDRRPLNEAEVACLSDRKADEFCQFRTIWKIVAMASTALHKPVKIFLPQTELDYFADFINANSSSAEYAPYDPAVLADYPPDEVVVAGDATVIVE